MASRVLQHYKTSYGFAKLISVIGVLYYTVGIAKLKKSDVV